MAVLVSKTMGAMNETHKPVYPLFEKPSKSVQPPSKNGVSPIEQTNPEVLSQPDLPSKKATSGGNEKTRKAAIAETSNPAVLSKSSAISHPDTENTGFLEVDPNHARRKRRKTASPESKELPEGDEERTRVSSPISSPTAKPPKNVASEIEQVPEICTKSPPNVVAISKATSDEPGQGGDGGTASSSKDGSNVIKTLPRAEQSKPKKILRFNPKTGTIGSPPTKKRGSLIEDASKPTQSRRGKQPKSKIVTIHYGHDRDLPPEVGLKIAQILQGNKVAASCAKNISILDYEQPKSMKVIGTNPAVPPHPFFLGKAAMKPPIVQKAVQSSPNLEIERPKESKTVSLARTGSPKRSSSKPTSSAFTGFAGFGNTAKILKFPGAIEPAWPWKGMTHIRGHDKTLHTMHLPINGFSGLPSRTRKSKYQAVEVLANEDVIGLLATELCMGQIVKSIKDINIDEHPPLPSCLRTPVKRFEAGPKLQERVRKELVTPLPPANVAKDDSSSEDEIQGNGSRRVRSHPALTKIYNAIATSLSAFDQSRCESQTWIHKYTPGAAAEVLQTGREAEILKEWLQKLTVMSVETSSGDGSNSRGSPVPRRPAGSKPDPSTKRKRKAKKLDGFVVSSDEEDNDMDEISEPEEDAFLTGSQGPLKRTVVRVGDASAKGSTRLTNAVVLSGPHGCGKTAAVYAVAKELGFEVFEINSSSRRSGKDILEKVGDMTRNHLVQMSQNQAPTEAVDEDAKRISDALEDDLKSGRQGTMNSFFKPRGSTKAISKPKKPDTTGKEAKAGKSNFPPKARPKQQKQSLILFEEVDVLYEEDKQFWATVMTMIIQSKRPIVMTCTDESSVPLSSLSLHAILRFTCPPIDLATDYMLLVAANEGHVIRRDAVKSLYESRHLDLRASLMELNFWCQFAVGDFRGGLDWFYSRWPSGSDVDEHGNTIRVVSEGTYQTGMGWLSQDFLESHLPYLDIEEETLHEAWDGWQLDVGDWQKTLDIPTWARKTQSLSKGKRDDLAALSIYADFSDEMSAADLCSSGAFASDSKTPLDVNPPELSPKAREDYILSHEVLEAAPVVRFENLGKDLSLWMRSRARKYLQVDQHIKHGLEIPTELDRPSEARVIELIRNQSSSPESSLSRKDFSLAFDPISEPEKSSLNTTGTLEASVFDRTMEIIATDMAPYVRSIVAYDVRLQQDRARLSNLLSEGGRRGKRMRTTRSAMSALEGGARSTTRRDRYFGPGLNPHFVLRTGMQSWTDAALAETKGAGSKAGRDVSTEGKETDTGVDELMGSS